MNLRERCFETVCGLGALMMVLPAMAGADVSPAAEETSLAEITVTAQKRTQNVQDVPIAITAFSEEALRSKGVTRPARFIGARAERQPRCGIAVLGLEFRVVGLDSRHRPG